jgi:PAT family beta-lactamase induction signal transducer AmpG
LVGGVVLLIAFAFASQDIVVDALRVESLSAAQAPAGAAVMVPAYRIGQLLAGQAAWRWRSWRGGRSPGRRLAVA